MKLSVFNPVLGDMPFESAMQYLAQCGVDAVEIGCGGYPGKAHCDPALLLEDEGALSAFKRVLKKNGLELAALSAHGNPVHPDQDVAESFRQDFQNAVLLAEKLGVEIEFIVIDWNNKIMELDSKNIDVVWNGMTLTDEVTSSMECTNPYVNNAQVVVTKAQ